mmetsp:Transcript_25719/g.53316  ORF Transcript_25719/g.53316 Transcript_25719/m.53316 type:complete len:232 (+) Transcript_25719:259-954(+)
MGYQDQPAGKLVDGPRQRIDHLHVQVVRGLIQQEHVGVHQGDEEHHHARTHAVGHGLHLARLELPRDPKGAQLATPLRLLEPPHPFGGHHTFRVEVSDESQRGHVQVQHILTVLVVVPDSQLSAALDLADCGLDLLQHQLQQRGLSGTVGSDKRNARVQVHTQLQLLVQVVLLLARVGEGDVIEGHHWRRDLLRVRECEGVLGIWHGLLCQARVDHLVDDLLLRIGLNPQV